MDDLISSCSSGECDLMSSPVSVKLADFGIGRRSSPGGGGVKGLMGTVGFMAPEIILYGGMEAYTEQVSGHVNTLTCHFLSILS